MLKIKKTLSAEVQGKIDFINKYRSAVNCTATEIKWALKSKVSNQYINIILSGNYIGDYNNEWTKDVLDTAIRLIEEKKKKLSALLAD